MASDATNLVAGDANGQMDVFIYERLTDAIQRVSVASDGSEANVTSGSGSFDPDVSGDGRYVVFASSADNLVPGDLNAETDVFLRDRQAGTTIMVSRSSDDLPLAR